MLTQTNKKQKNNNKLKTNIINRHNVELLNKSKTRNLKHKTTDKTKQT